MGVASCAAQRNGKNFKICAGPARVRGLLMESCSRADSLKPAPKARHLASTALGIALGAFREIHLFLRR